MAAAQRTIRFCTASDGTRIAYSMAGKGRPVVKSCMWLNDIESKVDSPGWAHWIALLSEGHQFVAHDLRGCGLSDRAVADTSLPAWVGHIEAVVDATALDRFVLVGLSQGAAIAIDYAARHPDKVAGLILCGGYTQGLHTRASSVADRELGEALAKMMEFGWGNNNAAFRRIFSARVFPDGTVEQIGWMNAQMKACTTPAMAARILRDHCRDAAILPDAGPACQARRRGALRGRSHHGRPDSRRPLRAAGVALAPADSD